MCIQTRQDMVVGILSRTDLVNCRDDLWDSATRAVSEECVQFRSGSGTWNKNNWKHGKFHVTKTERIKMVSLKGKELKNMLKTDSRSQDNLGVPHLIV